MSLTHFPSSLRKQQAIRQLKQKLHSNFYSQNSDSFQIKIHKRHLQDDNLDFIISKGHFINGILTFKKETFESVHELRKAELLIQLEEPVHYQIEELLKESEVFIHVYVTNSGSSKLAGYHKFDLSEDVNTIFHIQLNTYVLNEVLPSDLLITTKIIVYNKDLELPLENRLTADLSKKVQFIKIKYSKIARKERNICGEKGCCVEDLYIDTHEVDNIISPKQINIRQCKGNCVTNNTVPGSGCCHPSKYEKADLFLKNKSDNSVEIFRMNDLIISECECY
uniref:TGF_BETA_2 domain-containing protein n=1 Tax=Rhabditophanes sp. KR3021 TaxID=114890 RepID=A0AC35U1M3_9BILA